MKRVKVKLFKFSYYLLSLTMSNLQTIYFLNEYIMNSILDGLNLSILTKMKTDPTLDNLHFLLESFIVH